MMKNYEWSFTIAEWNSNIESNHINLIELLSDRFMYCQEFQTHRLRKIQDWFKILITTTSLKKSISRTNHGILQRCNNSPVKKKIATRMFATKNVFSKLKQSIRSDVESHETRKAGLRSKWRIVRKLVLDMSRGDFRVSFD